MYAVKNTILKFENAREEKTGQHDGLRAKNKLTVIFVMSEIQNSSVFAKQLFCEYIALFMWVERAAFSKTLIRDKGLNRGTCASDGCFTKRVGRRLTEQQKTLYFLNSKVPPK